jgi:hypothetical protein
MRLGLIIKNPELLLEYRNRECEICRETRGVVAHHLKTKGAGGTDSEENLLAVCFLCHHLIHHKGLSWATAKWTHLADILEAKGWEYSEMHGKWLFYKEEGCY